MPLNELQKKRLEGIMGKMYAAGEKDSLVEGVAQRFIAQIETQQQEHAKNIAAGEEFEPPTIGDALSKAGEGILQGVASVPGSIYGMAAQAIDPALAVGRSIGRVTSGQSTVGQELGKIPGYIQRHGAEVAEGLTPPIGQFVFGTPRQAGQIVGQFAGMAAAPEVAGAGLRGAGKAVGKVASTVEGLTSPRSTLDKANAMVMNAYQGALKEGAMGQPSSLEIANPYILAESKGKPWTQLEHHVIKAQDASGNFSDMMRGLEDQFKNVPLDLSQVADTVKSKIASISDQSVRKRIENWADSTFDASNVGDALKKRAELNREVRTYYKKNQMSQQDAMGDPATAADINAVNEVRNIIDKTIDKHAGGNINTRAMYQIESALQDVAEAGPEAVRKNKEMITRQRGTRGSAIGGQALGETAQAVAGGGGPFQIHRAGRMIAGPALKSANMPDNLVSAAGKLMQEGGKIRQPGRLSVQDPMHWWQNPPPATGVGIGFGGAGGGGVQGVSPGVAGSMPPAIRQPMQGQVVNPPPAPEGAPFVSRDIPPPMPNLVQVGPGRWVAQDVLEAGNPPSQVGPGRTFQLGPYSPATASDMELNQAAINRPAPRPVGKPPRSSWRMKPDVRAAQPQAGELDVTAQPEQVETQPFEIRDLRQEFTQPEVNPLVPERMQEPPLVREEMIRPPEGPTRKVGKPPRPLKVRDKRTFGGSERGSFSNKPVNPPSMQEHSINKEGMIRKPGEGKIVKPPNDPYAGAGGPTEPDMSLGGYASLNNISPAAQGFLGIKNRPVGPVETKPAPIGNLPDEPIVEKAPDWPGMGEGYHVRWPEMEKGSTVYVTPGETLQDKINKFKTDFPR